MTGERLLADGRSPPKRTSAQFPRHLLGYHRPMRTLTVRAFNGFAEAERADKSYS